MSQTLPGAWVRGWLRLLCLIVALSAAHAQITAPRLTIGRPSIPSSDWFRLSSSVVSNSVLTLEASTNIADWHEIATLHDRLLEYPDMSGAGYSQRFYRLSAATRGANNDWKNQILYPRDEFATRQTPGVHWVKFAILLNEPTRVYYQNSVKFPFHYDFATQRLAPFLGMDYPAFEAVSLYRANQQVVLGSVLYAPQLGGVPPSEYGVQFDGFEPYPPQEIARWLELVRATVCATNVVGAVAYYMPTFEQSEMTRTNAAAFAALGIPISSAERWIIGNVWYSEGWALGRLKYFAATNVVAAFADGRLRPEDILLTDGVPADTPIVAGIITLTPATPNSHTALLAQSFGVPFVYLWDANDRAQVQQLVGRKIILRASIISEAAEVKLLDVEDVLDATVESELRALKAPQPIQFMPKQTYGAISASTDALTPTDIQYFGGKAANYGFLRRYVPTNCPIAIALSFDLWDAFLDQTLPGGRTLRIEVATRLAPYTNYPPDIVSLKTNLAAIRDLFTRTASFTGAQQQAITNSLRVFNPGRKIRFRSSTNVEDSEHFIGAGLYDSYSGCLMDDLDNDTVGPSHCDPDENNERGVFRAIQKVYASFYNDDAFLERLRYRVDESQVAMGVLVHHSFPDEEELANGVATPRFTFTANSVALSSGDMVTQLGAASVTNPDGTTAPEVVKLPSLALQQSSSLVPLGAYVMSWPADYQGFRELFTAVANGFKEFYAAKNAFNLDFEYKKDVNLGLVLKQVREVPQPGTTNQVIPFLIDEPVPCTIWQGGFDIMPIHRLKSRWTLHTANMRMTPTNLSQGIYTHGTLEYVENGVVRTLTGPLNSWPNAANSPCGCTNYWTTGSGTELRRWTLVTSLTINVTGAQPPIFTQHDFRRQAIVDYATGVPDPRIGVRSSESVTIDPPSRALTGAGVLTQRTMILSNGMRIEASYYLQTSAADTGVLSPPLLRFVETRIVGLTSTPLVLTNYYSQTYASRNHRAYEYFVFEPRLEPGLPAATLAELNAANVQLIWVEAFANIRVTSYAMGLDRVFRPF